MVASFRREVLPGRAWDVVIPDERPIAALAIMKAVIGLLALR